MKFFRQAGKVFLLAIFLAACATSSSRFNTPPIASEEIQSQPKPVVQVPQQPETPPETKKIEKPVVKEAKKPSSPVIRVLLGENKQETSIKHTGRINVYTSDGSKKYKVSQAGTIVVKALSGQKIQVGTLQATQPIIIEPVNTQLEWNKNTYTGSFYVFPVSNKRFNLVEFVPLEDYLLGVLPYEMSPSWPVEALKAQAVAARTYTLKSLENVKTKTFDLYSDVRSQMYKGAGKKYDNVTKAVNETRGEVLKYDGKLFFTYYHANCGGGTDDVRSWNFKADAVKTLSGASCKFDDHSKNYTWSLDMPRSKVENFIQSAGLSGTLKNVKVSNKTSSGRATHLTISTKKGSKTISCPQFRLALGLRSCKITKISLSSNHVHFEGKGYGHGVGMCQDGANGMAKQNYNYKQILKHYYPHSTLTKIK